MSVSQPFIQRPVATSLLMVGVLMLGALGYRFLPVASLPSVDFPTIQVTAAQPGAGADTMAATITTPLEHQFGQITGLTAMTSTSSFGYAAITLQFDLDRNIDSAAQDVQSAIAAAAGLLPKNLPSPPTYSKVNPADTPVLILALTSATLPLSTVTDFADTVLAQKLSEIDGVGLVTVEGGQKPAVRLQVNPAALAAQGLTLEDIRTTLAATTVDTPKGNINGPRLAYSIGANDQLLSAEAYRGVIVAYRNGAPVRFSDVARVVDGTENARLAGWFNGQPAVILDIQRQPGANIIETVSRIHAALPRLETTKPQGILVNIVTDRTEIIRASVADVQFTLLLTVALVVMIIFLFLRKVWATVIPSVALPLSLIATFGVMYLAGFTLDNLSLMALTISAGFVVDDAIVMIENIVRYIEAGEGPRQAALKGARQIGFTVVSLTVSLVAVFIPLLFMGGVVGRLFREFSITLSVAVIASAVVSLTLTPMMCAQVLHREDRERQGWLFRVTEAAFAAMRAAYGQSLRMVLRHQTLTLAITAATLVGTIYLYVVVPKGFLPQQDTGLIVGVTDAAPDVSFQAMTALQRSVADVALRDPDVAVVDSFVGTGAINATPNTGRLFINLKPRGERRSSADDVVRRLGAAMEGLNGVTFYAQVAQDIQIDNRLGRTQYQLTLQDSNIPELEAWAPKLLRALREKPELSEVATDLAAGGLQVAIHINRASAARFGIQPQAIDDTLYDAFGQRQVATLYTQLNQYHVILEVDPNFQLDPAALGKIYVKAGTGQPVPLSAFATLDLVTAPLALSHISQFPAATLSFNLAPGASLGEAVTAIQSAEREIGLPEGIVTHFSGSAEVFRASLDNEPYLILAALIVVYIVLGVLYESYIHPITILSTLPSAGVGALLALMLTGNDLSIVSLIGIILLIGIVKKNAIMMIDFALDAERTQRMTPERSIFEASLLRFRPIMMTTMAALLGALPLALGTGVGSELRRPLGIAIVGGLLLSQSLTLYTTPVIYLAFDRAGHWVRRRLVGARAEPQRSGALAGGRDAAE